MKAILVLIFAILAVAFTSDVVDLTPDNFDDIVGGGKPTFIEFYAPWCGHCKNLIPELDKAAAAFKKAGDQVIIAKVDADKHKSLGQKYEVKGFPTLIYFDGLKKQVQFNGERDADGIITWINREAGTKVRSSKPPSFVSILDAHNFDSIVSDTSKNILIEFYAPWCGHCKKLSPIYDEVAGIFSTDTDVVIAKIDCDGEGNNPVCTRFDVTGFPTLKWFPKGRGSEKENEPYNSERTTNGIVDYVNERAGTKRLTTGLLKDDVGRLPAFDELVTKLKGGDDSAIKSAEGKAKELSGADKEFADIYVRFMNVYKKRGSSFPAGEKARLFRLIDGKSISKQKIDEFTIKYNILSAFV